MPTLRSSLSLTRRIERWPIAGAFTIARGAKTEAAVVVAEISDGTATGRGECVPYARYGETVEGVAAAIEAMRVALTQGLDRIGLQNAMPAGRRAQRARLRVLGFRGEGRAAGRCTRSPACRAPRPLVTAYTISLGHARRDGRGRRARPPRANCSR